MSRKNARYTPSSRNDALQTQIFTPYSVTSEAMALAADDAVFLHCHSVCKSIKARSDVLVMQA